MRYKLTLVGTGGECDARSRERSAGQVVNGVECEGLVKGEFVICKRKAAKAKSRQEFEPTADFAMGRFEIAPPSPRKCLLHAVVKCLLVLHSSVAFFSSGFSSADRLLHKQVSLLEHAA